MAIDNVPAASTVLFGPSSVAVDNAGNLYIADSGNSYLNGNFVSVDNNDSIRKVSNGVITTVAGNGTGGFRGDNGPAALL